MLVYTKRPAYLLFLFFVSSFFYSNQTRAQSVSLYTPLTKIIVPPGQAINYSIDVINNSSSIKTSNIKIVGLPKDWTYELKSGGWNIEQASELPKQKEKLDLKVNVPLKVDKGTYRFKILAEGYSSLPLAVVVSKQGSYLTEFTSNQSNIEGASNTTFTYNADLRNGTAQSQVYALKALQPTGWGVIFKANGKQVSSIDIEANQTKHLTIEITPTDYTKSGNYKIPILATGNNINARLELETVITGSFNIALSTPTGLLSCDVTKGEHKKTKLIVRNTGSTALNNIKLKAITPANWDVDFKPKNISHLEAGQEEAIEATINVDKKALSGDYETDFQARSLEASTKEKFRITVHASLLSGWLGILIILMALSSVYFLIRKFGRR